MKTIQQEYAYYQEGFEIFAFKYKTYGCGKWANTYDEAHELAKEAVLKKCMEENPHLAFQDKPVIQYNGHRTLSNNPVNLERILNDNNDTKSLSELGYEIPEKTNKVTIEEQIQACTTLKELESFQLIADMNDKLRNVYGNKFIELDQLQKNKIV